MLRPCVNMGFAADVPMMNSLLSALFLDTRQVVDRLLKSSSQTPSPLSRNAVIQFCGRADLSTGNITLLGAGKSFYTL